MQKSNLWVWKAYFIIYLYLTADSAYSFFSPASPMFWYYHTLIAANDFFIIPFSLNAASIILNILTLVVLYLFLARRAWLSVKFWAMIFSLRLFCDIFGKSYERKILQAIFHDDPATGWMAVGMLVSLSLPSYIAFYLYAFRREKLLKKS